MKKIEHDDKRIAHELNTFWPSSIWRPIRVVLVKVVEVEVGVVVVVEKVEEAFGLCSSL